MSQVERSIVIDVPVSAAYGQWTQFEDFPSFMGGVESVEQLDERTLHWRARVGAVVREWDAVITQQYPDRRIAWRSTSGAPNAGHVEFEPLGDRRTEMTLSMHFEPRGVVETAWTRMGMVGWRIDHDLHRFKQFIESRGQATDSWRGTVHRPEPLGTHNPEVAHAHHGDPPRAEIPVPPPQPGDPPAVPGPRPPSLPDEPEPVPFPEVPGPDPAPLPDPMPSPVPNVRDR
jgi:hypothetical protein